MRQALRPHKAQMQSKSLMVRQSLGRPGMRVLDAAVFAAVLATFLAAVVWESVWGVLHVLVLMSAP